jgi:hypothetical protein
MTKRNLPMRLYNWTQQIIILINSSNILSLKGMIVEKPYKSNYMMLTEVGYKNKKICFLLRPIQMEYKLIQAYEDTKKKFKKHLQNKLICSML